MAQKKWAEAESTLRESINMGRSQVGLGHPRAAIAVKGFAHLLRQRGKASEATQLYQEMLEAQKERPGFDPARRADAVLDFAEHLSKVAAAEKRPTLAPAALTNCRKIVVPRRKLGESLNLLGVAYFRAKQWPEAEDCFLEAVDVEPDLARTAPELRVQRVHNLAVSRIEQGRTTPDVRNYLAEVKQLTEALPAEKRPVPLAEIWITCAHLELMQEHLNDAAEQARLVVAHASQHPHFLLRAAGVLAHCAAMTSSDADQSDAYAREAIQVLRVALKAGLNPKMLQAAPELTHLRKHAEFQKLLEKK
jgi:tetratricopeptide (TPR) repeat protein